MQLLDCHLLSCCMAEKSTYLLSDAKKWHASQPARYHIAASPETLASSAPPTVSDDSTALELDHRDAMECYVTSAHVRRPPIWCEDFVTEVHILSSYTII